ncbi:MAG TPA: hypothetical protein VJJ22_01995 [Candidatus Paceibacterota bacterium]
MIFSLVYALTVAMTPTTQSQCGISMPVFTIGLAYNQATDHFIVSSGGSPLIYLHRPSDNKIDAILCATVKGSGIGCSGKGGGTPIPLTGGLAWDVDKQSIWAGGFGEIIELDPASGEERSRFPVSDPAPITGLEYVAGVLWYAQGGDAIEVTINGLELRHVDAGGTWGVTSDGWCLYHNVEVLQGETLIVQTSMDSGVIFNTFGPMTPQVHGDMAYGENVGGWCQGLQVWTALGQGLSSFPVAPGSCFGPMCPTTLPVVSDLKLAKGASDDTYAYWTPANGAKEHHLWAVLNKTQITTARAPADSNKNLECAPGAGWGGCTFFNFSDSLFLQLRPACGGTEGN